MPFIRLTCVSVTFSNLAISDRSLDERYFFTSNCFSNSKICLPVNVVLAFFFLLLSPQVDPPVSDPPPLCSLNVTDPFESPGVDDGDDSFTLTLTFPLQTLDELTNFFSFLTETEPLFAVESFVSFDNSELLVVVAVVESFFLFTPFG